MEHSAQSFWSDLATAALMGTGRRAFTPPQIAGPLGDVLGEVAGAESPPESKLLAAAAVAATYRRAGMRASVEPSDEALPCPEDELPPTGVRSGDHLRAMLDGPHAGALGEWLGAVAASGRRIRDRDLVELLEHGREHPPRREAILAVIGRRGRWLAAQNPAWSFAALAEPADEDWQTANRDGRIAQLRRLRGSEPATARDLVASTWSQETPADRAAFLAEFEAGLSMEDEPLLEAALDDSRAEVRRAAAELLGRLPESRLCRRMIERVGPLVRLVGRDGKLDVDITLPESYGKDLARDGIARTQPGMGEKNAWLAQMIGLVPPSYWNEATGLSPDELLRAIHRSEWELVLSWGWTNAAERHRDPAWLEAVVRRAIDQEDLGRLRSALPHLGRDRRETLLTEILSGGRAMVGYHLHLIAEAVPVPWDVAFSREIVDRISGRLQSADRMSDPGILATLRVAGYAVPISLLEELVGLFPLNDPSVPPFVLRPIQDFLDAVRFRHQALTELSS